MARTVRANRPALLVAAGMLFIIGTVELLLPSPLWWRTYLLGFLTASIIGVVLWSLDLLSGTHNQRLGIVGETAEAVLARRQRR